MGTEKFNYIKPSVAHGDNVALQYAVAGDPVSGKLRSDAAHSDTNSNIQPAGLFSTAPYRPPGTVVSERAKGRDKKCLGGEDTCNAWATRTGYCSGHSRSMGLI